MADETAEGAETDRFALKDCALLTIATGVKVTTLKEFVERLASVERGCIYYHFWGELLQPRFEEREYNNDFASWVRHGIHDDVLAERLAVVNPTNYDTLESLREEVIGLVEERMDETDSLPWRRATQQFEFIHSRIVVFDTRHRAADPYELHALMPHLSSSSVFYHFIDARRRTEQGRDDFSLWLRSFGDRFEPLCHELENIDPYFDSLRNLRDQIADTLERFTAEATQ